MLTYQSTMRVPFIVAGPGISAGRVVPARVGTIDLVPTALALLGADADASLLGRDLRPLIAGGPLASDPLYQESLFGQMCRFDGIHFTLYCSRLLEPSVLGTVRRMIGS